MGDVALSDGDHVEAGRLYRDSEERFRAAGDAWGLARSCTDLGHLAMARGDLDEAGERFIAALHLFQQLGHRRGIALLLEGCAQLAALQDRAEPALVMAGAARRLRDNIAIPGRCSQQARLDEALAPVREGLDADAADACRDLGAAMPLCDAVAYALEATRPVAEASAPR
jgi:hypothetical protein